MKHTWRVYLQKMLNNNKKILSTYSAIWTRDATIQFFQNRSDTTNSEDRPIPIQSDTSAGIIFFFKCNLEFLYFSVLTRLSLFCVLNTIYYSVSQLVGAGYAAQTWVARPFWVGHGLFTAKETTSTKNVILNAFLMQEFYFKRRAWKLLTLLSDHLTPRQFK